jgi:hypothetical protein
MLDTQDDQIDIYSILQDALGADFPKRSSATTSQEHFEYILEALDFVPIQKLDNLPDIAKEWIQQANHDLRTGERISPPFGFDTGPPLFKACRLVLGYSPLRLADLFAMEKNGAGTIERWERGVKPIPGPIWIALLYYLEKADEWGLVEKIEQKLLDMRRNTVV